MRSMQRRILSTLGLSHRCYLRRMPRVGHRGQLLPDREPDREPFGDPIAIADGADERAYAGADDAGTLGFADDEPD